jgi:outer membrane protein W
MKVRWAALFVVAIATIMMAGVAAATEPGWQLKVKGIWADPNLDDREADEDIVATASADGAFGLGLGVEYLATERFGIELGVMRATPDINVRLEAPLYGTSISESDELTMTPLTLGLNVHLTPNAPVDVYIGPMLAYVMYDDIELELGDEREVIRFEDDFTWGVNLGADYPLGERWSLTAGVSYLDTVLEDKSDDDEDDDNDSYFGTTVFSVGAAFRF